MAKSGVEVKELKESVEELLDETQEITLSENGADDTENSHVVHARNVLIRYGAASTSGEQIRHHSHYVSTKPCIEYKWEKSFYPGHLIAVHMSGRVFAYALQTHHSGKVRVTNDETSNEGRCLLKEFTTQLVDIDFAHVPDSIYIACMEQNGWCTVFSIVDDKPMTYELLVKVRITDEVITPEIPCRAIWCVHVPEPGQKPFFQSTHDPSSRLILTTGGRAAVVSVPVIQNAAGPEKTLTLDGIPSKGVATIVPGANIWDGKMSPDGVVLCVAREDGNVHFYQCVLHKGESLVENGATLVYTWTPHDGRPVHSIHFFDDFTPTSVQEQFWMFAVSGSEFGRQFRIWNCQRWYCLQTIDVLPSPSRPLEEPQLQVTVDPKGDYLILGDTQRNLVLFLRVDKDVVKRLAMVTCVNEFLVGSPILNLVAVSLKAIRPERESLLPLDPEENGLESRLLTLHSHLLQHMSVSYVGEQLPNAIPSTNDTIYEETTKPTHSKQSLKSESSSSNQGINGEQPKIRENKKKNKKNRDDFHSLDNVPTPSAPVDTNGGQKNSSRNELTLEESSPSSISPAFVLQPPSAFDQVISFLAGAPSHSKENISASKQSSPFPAVNLMGSRDSPSGRNIPPPMEAESVLQNNLEFAETLVSNPTELLVKKFIRQRDESVSCFTAPPVEDSQEDHFSTIRPRKGESPLAVRDFDQGDLSRLPLNGISSDRLDRLEGTLSAIVSALDQQSQVVQRLAGTVENLKLSQLNGSTNREDASKKNAEALNKSLAGSLKDIQGLENRLTASVEVLSRGVETTLVKEIKNQLGSGLQKSLKPLGDKLTADVVAKLGGLDSLVRQRLDEAVRSPQFAQVMAQSVSGQFVETAKHALQDVLSNQMVTAYQHITNQSLGILNQTFSNGTKDYLTQVNRSLETHFGHVDEAFNERFKQLEGLTERACAAAVQNATKNLLKDTQTIVEQNLVNFYNQIMANLGGQISQKVTTFVKEELREQQSVMHESMVSMLRSGVATPGGQLMVQQQRTHLLMQDIKVALDKRDYNTAFRLALSETDLAAVLFVCENVKVDQVFQQPDILQMPVLFSLIQQLAVDIGSKTELKIQYLEGALLAIRFDDLEPSSFKFLRTVLGDVTKVLNKFLLANPDHAMYRSIRMIAQYAALQLGQITAM